MPLRVYGKWNIKGFCKSYFDLVSNSSPDSYMSTICGKPLRQRCVDNHYNQKVIDEIRISLADCRSYVRKGTKLYDDMKKSVTVLTCALECNKTPKRNRIKPKILFDDFVKSPKEYETYPIPIITA